MQFLAWFSGVQELYPALYERVSFGSDGCINSFQMPARNRMISQCHHCVPDSLGFGGIAPNLSLFSKTNWATDKWWFDSWEEM